MNKEILPLLGTKGERSAVVVGRPEILSSSHVVEAPAHVNKPVPVPSVYLDARGEIHNFQIGGRRLNLLFTKAGVMRSGDIHKDRQHDFVFSGKVEVWILQADETTSKQVYGENQYLCIPPFTPHLFHFLEDTVIAEWWDGPFHAWFYEPYRLIVEKTISASKGTGVFAHYYLSSIKGFDIKEVITKPARHPSLWAGLLAGLTIGFMIGKRR